MTRTRWTLFLSTILLLLGQIVNGQTDTLKLTAGHGVDNIIIRGYTKNRRLKKSALIFLFLFAHICFSQTIEKKDLTGKYVGEDHCAISYLTLTINKSGKFESNYSGHYNKDKIDKGRWKINGDTLTLQRKKETWYKFKILERKLCEIKEDTAFCRFCILKQ